MEDVLRLMDQRLAAHENTLKELKGIVVEILTSLRGLVAAKNVVSKPVYNVKEAAERLGYADWYVRDLCRDGKLAGTRIDGGAGGKGEWRITKEAILKYEATHPRAGRREKKEKKEREQ